VYCLSCHVGLVDFTLGYNVTHPRPANHYARVRSTLCRRLIFYIYICMALKYPFICQCSIKFLVTFSLTHHIDWMNRTKRILLDGSCVCRTLTGESKRILFKQRQLAVQNRTTCPQDTCFSRNGHTLSPREDAELNFHTQATRPPHISETADTNDAGLLSGVFSATSAKLFTKIKMDIV